MDSFGIFVCLFCFGCCNMELLSSGDIDFQCPNRNYTFLESDRFKCMLSTRVKCDTCLILGLLP